MELVVKKHLNKTFIVKEAIGIIPERTYLYCFKEDENHLWCFSNCIISGTNQVTIPKSLLFKLKLA
jgi:hypothetical protein